MQPMPKKSNSEAGFTLIEVMVVAGLFVVSMVVLMGSLLTIMRHSQIADMRVAAINLNHSTLDFIRGMEWDDLKDFVHPTVDPDTGVAFADGLGDITISAWAIIPDPGNPPIRLLLGSEAAIDMDSDDVPNPVELQFQIQVDAGVISGNDYQFSASIMHGY